MVPFAHGHSRQLHQVLRWALVATVCGLSLFLVACSQITRKGSRSYETLPNQPQKRAEEAKSLNHQGLEALEAGELDAAEKLFREALAVDVDYGPAHNNLGQVYLKRHQLYLAAWEFEFAANLMPESVEPLLNLGLAYEAAGRLEQAIGYYESAISIDPHNAIALGSLARASIKADADPAIIHHTLSELLMHESRREWVAWAQQLLATQYQGSRAFPLDSESLSPSQNLPIYEQSPEVLPVPVPGDHDDHFEMPHPTKIEFTGFARPVVEQFPELPPQFDLFGK